MDEDRNLDHDGLLKESSSSVMARLQKTTAFICRVLPMVIALLVFVLVLVGAVLVVLIKQDSKSYQAEELQADQIFAKYGAPPDHGQEWTCFTFVNNIQCWDGFYTYLHTQSGWTLLQGPDDRRKLFTHTGD
eukprot:scaffold3419_cov142-Amphora_coffeaeformis.AAC.7